jgi:ABC-2 type transport system permease protein
VNLEHLRNIVPVARKEFRQIRRDVRSLVFLLAMPAFLLVMFGFALNFDIKHIPLGVWDQDGSRQSRKLTDKFTNTEYFDLVARIRRPGQVDRLMGREKIRVAVIIPPKFADDLAAGRSPSIQVIIDGANAMTGSTAAGYVAAIVRSYSEQATLKILERHGIHGLVVPLEADLRVWYNPELKSVKFLVPGLMAFILMVIVVVSISFSVVREKERGTMEQILVSPIHPVELVVGKVIPYILISLVSAHLVLLFGWGLFGVRIEGSYPLLLLTMVLFLLGALGQGILISTVTRTQQVAFMVSVLTTLLPTFILSGFVFPLRNMPVVIQGIAHLVPARYFLVALRAIILKGAGLEAFWTQLLFLGAFAALTLGASTARLVIGAGEDHRRRRRSG